LHTLGCWHFGGRAYVIDAVLGVDAEGLLDAAGFVDVAGFVVGGTAEMIAGAVGGVL
jgi:hypothetical protein